MAAHRYERALRLQPSHPLLDNQISTYLAYILLATGNILVLSSMWALGLTGTYLGDYFGILMDHRVTSFPFNVCSAPMYYGSTLSFLGTAFLYGKPAGVLLTIEVFIVYLIALQFEEYVQCLHVILSFMGTNYGIALSPLASMQRGMP
jgi:methylene-fatty-acyl-phospholipid synthase